jgi:hypothetical protein
VSPSWTERARLAPRQAAGIAIGRDSVGFARLGVAAGQWRVRDVHEASLPVRLFNGAAPSQAAAAALAQALAPLAAALKRRFMPLHVSVPDAAVRYGVFELDELPKRAPARLELVRLRFARQGANGSSVYACQALAEAGGRRLLGMSIDAAWQRLILEALATARLRPWSMNANVCRQWNRFHDRITQTSGALVALTADAWSLWLWDELGSPRYARARWRQGSGDYAEIAQEAERAILAYVHGGPDRELANVYAVGNGETEAMAAALDTRLREPCIRLEEEHAAVAAALER